MTKLGIISDCHLEFGDIKFNIPEEIDILIFAGDMHKSPGYASRAFKKIADLTDAPMLYVLGNHEFYRQSFPTAVDKYERLMEDIPNLYLMNNKDIIIDDILFLGTTLWSDLSDPIESVIAEGVMNDYKMIKNPLKGYTPISPADTTKAFKQNVKWLSTELEHNKDEKIVVITHHLPSFSLIHKDFKGNDVNAAYASNLNDLISKYSPDVWIFGHTHDKVDLTLDRTKFVSNAIGYPMERKKEKVAFKIIEI